VELGTFFVSQSVVHFIGNDRNLGLIGYFKDLCEVLIAKVRPTRVGGIVDQDSFGPLIDLTSDGIKIDFPSSFRLSRLASYLDLPIDRRISNARRCSMR
jgi:hypothetical protein